MFHAITVSRILQSLSRPYYRGFYDGQSARMESLKGRGFKTLNPSRALVPLQTTSCHRKLPANWNGIEQTRWIIQTTQTPPSNTHYDRPKARLQVNLLSSSQYSNKEILENDSHAGSYTVLLFQTQRCPSKAASSFSDCWGHGNAESDYISPAAGVIMVRDVVIPQKGNALQGRKEDQKNQNSNSVTCF